MRLHLRQTLSTLLYLTFAVGTASAAALDGAALYKEKTCVSCHGADANTPVLPSYPKLAGQNVDYLVLQLNDIKSGVRKNAKATAMQGIMIDVDDDEIRAIAEWLGSLESE